MEKHNCVILKNAFGQKENYYCHICGVNFSPTDKIKQDIYLDIYNLILDEQQPIYSTEALVVWLKERIAEVTNKPTGNN